MHYPVLTIVVPCYNEEEVFQSTAAQLTSVMETLISDKLISEESKLLFVDDGSKDNTWKLIEQESENNEFVKGLKLAHNAGHQNALLAGLATASKLSDCVISIDADLQDDVNVIHSFVEKYWQGYDIVYGVRNDRSTDTFFKRNTAVGYYRFMNKIGISLVPNHADFRLMSKRALEELLKYKETNIFLRGIIPLIGFPATEVAYARKERMAGESKYPLKKMIAFALDGITSFSIAPIRLVTAVGFLAFFISLLAGAYSLIVKLLDHSVTGWSSLMMSVWLIGGLQLIGIGIIGEYVGKIFKEVKKRPVYAIETDLYTPSSAGQQSYNSFNNPPVTEEW
ncbi:glycosyltransferase family 2 protein [Bacillus sp. MUM 13]|uniref:glycosyltransferase family 2 protein n=1 Tax=Bacillus sp. MUM 13 TaxID=1678001 RepID=UPI0008F59F71|nr:glycosyltransferase family 2 protein [Bacillus sp. MUM 13]OIK13665.1 glycosyltransferase [Bacillus sp. MUM 13]